MACVQTTLRGGSLLEHHQNLRNCPEIGLELGVNYSSKTLVDRGDENYLVDRADPSDTSNAAVVWEYPLPPSPLPLGVF